VDDLLTKYKPIYVSACCPPLLHHSTNGLEMQYTVIPEFFFATHLIFIAIIIDMNLYYATAYSIMLVRAAATRNASPSMKNQCQLASYFRYPLVAGILDLAETCPTRGPTEDESLGCRPFISPQNLWLSHLFLFDTNYQGRAILRTRDRY